VTRAKLVRLLGVHIVEVEVVVSLLEARAGSYVLLRPFSMQLRPELLALQNATHGLSARLGALSDDATDQVLNGLSMKGYSSDFLLRLKEALGLLSSAIQQACEDTPPSQAGRPPARARGWFARQIRLTLEQDGGVNTNSRAGARLLGQCLRLVWGGVQETLPKTLQEHLPSNLRDLLKESRQP